MTRLFRNIVLFVEWLALSGGYLASCALLIMTIGVTLDVLARFLLGAGTKLAIEVSGYLLVAVVFFGLAYTHQQNAHIRVDILVNRLPRRARHWYRLFESILFLSYTMVLGYFGWKSFLTSYRFDTTSRTGLDVLIWPYQLIIPLGLALTSFLLICNIFTDVNNNIKNTTSGASGDSS